MELSDVEKIIKILEKAQTIIEKWVPMFEQYNTPVGIDYAIALIKNQEECIKKFELERSWDENPDAMGKW